MLSHAQFFERSHDSVGLAVLDGVRHIQGGERPEAQEAISGSGHDNWLGRHATSIFFEAHARDFPHVGEMATRTNDAAFHEVPFPDEERAGFRPGDDLPVWKVEKRRDVAQLHSSKLANVALKLEAGEGRRHAPEANVPRARRCQSAFVRAREAHAEDVLSEGLGTQDHPLVAPVPHREQVVRSHADARQLLAAGAEGHAGVALLCASAHGLHNLELWIRVDQQVWTGPFFPHCEKLPRRIDAEAADAIALVPKNVLSCGWLASLVRLSIARLLDDQGIATDEADVAFVQNLEVVADVKVESRQCRRRQEGLPRLFGAYFAVEDAPEGVVKLLMATADLSKAQRQYERRFRALHALYYAARRPSRARPKRNCNVLLQDLSLKMPAVSLRRPAVLPLHRQSR
eukprot:scaffold63_cov306-Pinguiococcus_pyrenoidosus.AAC.90